MRISIEKRKVTGGKLSLRLVYYFGTTTDAKGKTKHKRKLETLDLFVYQKPKSNTEKQHNKEHLQLAEAIRSKRTVEAQSGKHQFTNTIKKQTDFFQYLDEFIFNKKREKKATSTIDSWLAAFKHIRNFHPEPTLPMNQITIDFVSRYAAWLKTVTCGSDLLSVNTTSVYFEKFIVCVRACVKRGLIENDPTENIKGLFKKIQEKRVYLTLDELRKIASADCKNDTLKRMFIFSCLTGLRWGDVSTITWGNIETDNGHHKIVFNQQKTKGLQYLDIPDQAYHFLGDRTVETTQPIFKLAYSNHINTLLMTWALDAGLNKKITFHAGRHTFAVVQLMQGTSLYTLSRLMGHTSIKTTQIYADIVDSERKAAMNAIPSINL